MPRAVDGTYETPSNSVAPAVASTTIDPDDFNTLVTDLETAISETLYTSAGLGSTDNRLVRTDGNSQKKAQGSAIAVDDSGNMSGMGYMDIGEIAAPASPSANTARLYCVDSSGTTKLAYKDSAGTVTTIEPSAGGGGGIAGNNVINPSMRIAQQGTSFTSTSTPVNNDDTYTLDGWYILADGADTIDVTQSTESPTGGLNSIALDVETANRKFGIAQIIEQRDCIGYIGATVTFSFYAKVSATTNLDNVKCAIVAWSGTADTVTSDIISAWGTEGTNPTLIANATYENTPANLNVTTSWARYSVSAAVDTASAKNIILLIWSDVTTTSVGGADILYITDVKLEVGSSATTFEAPNYVHDLLRCQRFYWRWGYENADAGTGFRMFGNGGFSGSGIFEGQSIKHPVQMRSVPTMTKVGTWTVSNCGQPSVSDQSTISCTISAQPVAAGSFDFYPNTTGYLEADARL